MFAQAYDLDGQMHVTVTHDIGDRETRFIALDVNNVEHEALNGGGTGSALGVWQHTPRFDVSMDEVVLVSLQARPYEQVEFRNVSLRPGVNQEVEIVSLGVNTIEEQWWDRDPWIERDKDSNRRESKDLLQAFYLALVRYVNNNDDARLPERITGLTIMRVEHGVEHGVDRTAAVDFVKNLEYFGERGFRSLSPDQLDSDRAIPLVYCKKILELEKGVGTHVLFGDGHVEWITAQKLDVLKSR